MNSFFFSPGKNVPSDDDDTTRKYRNNFVSHFCPPVADIVVSQRQGDQIARLSVNCLLLGNWKIKQWLKFWAIFFKETFNY
jgi:hypothetical protein